MRLKGVKVVVLDFDGVVIESNSIKHTAFAKIFKSIGDKYEQIMDYHFAHHSVDRFEKFRFISEEILRLSGDEALEKQRLWVRQFSVLTEAELLQCPTVAGAQNFLQAVHGKIPIYLASATPESILKDLLSRRALDVFFKQVYGAPINKSEVLLAIRAKENVELREMLFVGDSHSDLEAAKKAGIPSVGRLTDYQFQNVPVAADLNDVYKFLIEGESL